MENNAERERERGQWTDYYTSPQSLIMMFLICWLYNFGDYMRF